ncbi:MAG: DUF4384 domain-containing protein [Burkholderiaceae bacterium]|nr:DUF4384 domain-containing protein [Burkholderiaceae bacterium]
MALIVAALVAGCATNPVDTKRDVREQAAAVSRGPQSAPFRSITSFSDGLRCMDNLLLDYGVRDVAVIVEDILDETKKVNAGTKEMLISAISDMTRRSRAIKPIAYGRDSGNTIGFLFQAQQREHFAVVPPFGIRGSITQFDDAIVRKNLDGGISLSTNLSLGAANTATASVIGLDLNVIATNDLSVVAGVTSRNSVIVLREGRGLESEAAIKKFGINFSVSVARQEGQSQALRTLVELAAIELIGRLARVPYWTCLGAADAEPAVQEEVRDWYDAMIANPPEMIEFFQRQMRARRLYNGPLDGVVNEDVKAAIAHYRAALGLSREPKISLDFFQAYLRANHREVMSRLATIPVAAVPPGPAAPATPAARAEAAPAAAPLTLAVTANGHSGAQVFPRGALIGVQIRTNRDAHVYCFLRDENATIQRFYPNRFRRDSLLLAQQTLDLPGQMRFAIVANQRGVRETIACFATERDVLAELPPAVAGGDFEPLSVKSIEQLRAAFAAVTRNTFGEAYFHVDVR